MKYDVKEALDEIMDISPMYRRDVIINYMHKYLPKDEAKQLLFEKSKEKYLQRMISQGCTDINEIMDIIGPERVRQFIRMRSRMS